MLSFHPQDRPTIEQVFNHPWLKATNKTTTSSHSQTKRPPQASSSTLSSSGSYRSYSASLTPSSSSYGYHVPLYHHSQAPPLHRVAPSAYQSNRSPRPAPGNRTPASSRPIPSAAFNSPIQTRSKSRLSQCPPAGERHSTPAGGKHGPPIGAGGGCGAPMGRGHGPPIGAGGGCGAPTGRGHGCSNPAGCVNGTWIGGVPKTPQMPTRKCHQQVTRKK